MRDELLNGELFYSLREAQIRDYQEFCVWPVGCR